MSTDPLVGRESLCHAQLDKVLKGRKVYEFDRLTREFPEGVKQSSSWTNLHPCIVDIESEVPIANLQRRCLVANQASSNNIMLRHDSLPS